MSASPHSDLTGVWDGQFEYPRNYEPTSFTCVLMDVGGALSGTITEHSNNGPTKGQTLEATLLGSRRDSDVRFTKLYPARTANHDKPVLYAGTLSLDGFEIEGEWTVPGSWSGRFLMIRSEPDAEAVEDREAAEVPFV